MSSESRRDGPETRCTQLALLIKGRHLGWWWQGAGRANKALSGAGSAPERKNGTIARQLIAKADVLVGNFRPSTLEGWGRVAARLHQLNPAR